MFASTLIIGLAFIPLFSMTGVAGVIFSPMAHTYAFAIGGAILLALTLTPVLSARYLEAPGGTDHEAHENALMRTLSRVYRPVFRFAMEKKWWAVGISAFVVVAAVAATPLLGREFMPKLEEGNFWIRASLPVSVSLDQSSKYVGRIRAILLGCPASGECEPGKRKRPEIATVVSQLGRPDDGTDPVGFYNIELFAPLSERSQWRTGVTKESLTEELSAELSREFPGVVFNFSQVIADNVEEAMSGVKGENTVKVVGPDVMVDEEKAQEVIRAMARVRGVQDLGIFRSLGQPVLRITPDRVKAGRYGLNVGDVGAVVQAAIGGQAVTQVYEGERHFDLVVRWAAPFRKDADATVRHPPRVGGGDRPAERDHRETPLDRAGLPRAHRTGGLPHGEELGGCAGGTGGDPGCLLGGNPCAADHPHDLLHLRGDGVHLHLRSRGAGRADRGHRGPGLLARGHVGGAGRARRRPAETAAGADDHVGRDARAVPRRSVPGDRQ